MKKIIFLYQNLLPLLFAVIMVATSLQAQVEVNFSKKRGYYDVPILLELSSDDPSVTIRYTTNNTKPTRASGTVYTSPIEITNFKTVRAIAYTNSETSKVKTHSYFVFPQFLSQPYFQSHITNSSTWGNQLEDALRSIPTVVITQTSTLSESQGEVSMEYIDPTEQDDFQIDCAAKKFGNASLTTEKYNIRLFFKSEFGEGKLSYPLFKGFENGVMPVDKFDQIELRGDVQNSWLVSNPEFSELYIGPRFLDNTMLEMGEINTHGRFVHLFIDGNYRGQYHLRERMDEDFMVSYLGGNKSDYEMIDDQGPNLLGNWSSAPASLGTGAIWNDLVSRSSNFLSWKNRVNVNNFFDFILVFMYGQHENEYKAVGSTMAGRKYHFKVNDGDGTFNIYDGINGNYTHNRTDPNGTDGQNVAGPDGMFKNLYNERHPDFLMAFADRVHCACFDEGALTPTRAIQRIDALVSEIETSMIAESARWGSASQTPATWKNDINKVKNGYARNRTGILVAHLKERRLYPSTQGGSLFNEWWYPNGVGYDHLNQYQWFRNHLLHD